MRIIAGTAGSIPIAVPKSLARPTTDRVRESVFASLGDRIHGAEVLDLFAGSGALGLEALSRGAESTVFVDSDRAATKTIEKNLEKARLSNGTVFQQNVISYLSAHSHRSFDLIFADPPYAREEESTKLLETLLSAEALPAMLAENGLLILETLASSPLPEICHWNSVREKKYGRTRVSYLQPTS